MVSIIIDRASEHAVYEQIARQIRMLIAAGELEVGAILPPVRILASDLGVNLNTVARAYRMLEDEGFVRIRNREGTKVLAPAGRVQADERRQLNAELGSLLWRMRQAGFSGEELRQIVERELDTFPVQETGMED